MDKQPLSELIIIYSEILPVRHLTPASSACVQKSMPVELATQPMSDRSLPVHCTLFNHILPVPSPNLASVIGSAPEKS